MKDPAVRSKLLLAAIDSIEKFGIEGCTIRAIATFHPAYLLRTPIGKRLAWRDLLAIEEALAGG